VSGDEKATFLTPEMDAFCVPVDACRCDRRAVYSGLEKAVLTARFPMDRTAPDFRACAYRRPGF
jgi:hypothetical protein